MFNWKPVLKKITSCLKTWKFRHLSVYGRVCLLNLVLFNLSLYYISLLKIPFSVAKNICKVALNFLATPKAGEGLRVGSIMEKINKSMSFKWLWRYNDDISVAWRNFLDLKYQYDNNKVVLKFSETLSLIWNSIYDTFNGVEDYSIAYKMQFPWLREWDWNFILDFKMVRRFYS